MGDETLTPEELNRRDLLVLERARRNHTVVVEATPEFLSSGVFSDLLHVKLEDMGDGTHRLVFRQSDELTRLRATLERVRALHVPVGYDVDLCWACWKSEPCPTLRALDGDA